MARTASMSGRKGRKTTNSISQQVHPNKKRTVVILFFLALLFMSVLMGVIILQNQNKKNKISLQKSSLAHSYANIYSAKQDIKKIYQPEDSVESKRCQRINNPNEFAKGYLYCYVTFSASYPVKDSASALVIAQKIDSLISEGQGAQLSIPNSIDDNKDYIKLGSYKYDYYAAKCSRDYVFFSRDAGISLDDLKATRLTSSEKGLNVELYCEISPVETAIF